MKNDNAINNLYNNQTIKETILKNNGNNFSNSNIESFKVYIRIKPHLHKDINPTKNINNLINNILLKTSPKKISKKKLFGKNKYDKSRKKYYIFRRYKES